MFCIRLILEQQYISDLVDFKSNIEDSTYNIHYKRYTYRVKSITMYIYQKCVLGSIKITWKKQTRKEHNKSNT